MSSDQRVRATLAPDNIENIRALIKSDARIKANQIARAVEVSSRGTVITVLQEHLNLSKIPPRLIPNNLTNHQKQQRADKSLAMLHRYQENPAQFLRWLGTGDERWTQIFIIS